MTFIARLASSPRFCLWTVGWLTALLIQTGAFSTHDTRHRYQVTRWLWRGEPEVSPGAYPDFGIFDPEGGLHAWYGLGQSLLMFPGDVLARALTGIVGLGAPLDTKAEIGIVALSTFPVLTGFIVMLGYSILRELGIDQRRATVGAIVWLVCTTCLTYAQAHFENSLELAAFMAVFLGALLFGRTGARAPLFWGMSAGALAILARVPSVIDITLYTLGALFITLPRPTTERVTWLRRRAFGLATIAAPILLAALALDRAYQVFRFGWDAIDTTYIHIWGEQWRSRVPGSPENYAFSAPFSVGFWGPLFSRNNSMLLYDPLLWVAPFVFVFAARMNKLERGVRVLLVVAGLALLCRLVLYAKFVVWYGGSSWSNRYTLTPVQFGLLFVVPVFLAISASVPRALRTAFFAVCAFALVLQLSSVLINPNLEFMQAQCRGGTHFEVRDRLLNVFRLLTGRLDDGGCPQIIPPETLRMQFLPWSNGPELPRAARLLVEVGWFGLLIAAGAAVTWTLRRHASGQSAAHAEPAAPVLPVT
jgi:hypothetical protein